MSNDNCLRFLFQGDSVTDAGRQYGTDDLGPGYASYFARRYESLRETKPELPELEVLNRAVSGDRSLEVRTRQNEDILDLKPDILCLQIGINDAWRLLNPDIGATPDGVFEEAVTEVLRNVQQALPQTKIILIEPYLLAFDEEMKPVRRNLYQKINVLRELRRSFVDFYWPLDGLMHQWSMDYEDPGYLAIDGVHPTDAGHKLIGESLADTLVTEGFFDKK